MNLSYLVSVSYNKGCYRHIRISATSTLYDLHTVILGAFDFIDDHAHIFFMNNRTWDTTAAYASAETDLHCRLTSDYTLSDLKLTKGKTFKYLFDFGEEHLFQCRVLQELNEPTIFPVVVRRAGESPKQYADWDDNEDKSACTNDDLLPLPEVYPEERITQLLDALPMSEQVVSQLYTYFLAAARLYGIIPLGELLSIYNRQNPPVSEADFLAMAEIFYHAEAPFVILGEEHLYLDAKPVPPIQRELIDLPLVTISIEMYYAVKEGQQGRPYAVLPKALLLKHAEPEWYPKTPQSEALEQFLARRKTRLDQAPGELVAALYYMTALEAPMEMIMEFVSDAGLQFSGLPEIQEFSALYQEFSNHTRKPILRGHTPHELAEELGSKRS